VERSAASLRLSFHRTGSRCPTSVYGHEDDDDDGDGLISMARFSVLCCLVPIYAVDGRRSTAALILNLVR
jgi:hypothetical protein